MYEGFRKDAIVAMENAQRRAARQNASYVGDECILWGILALGERTRAARALKKLGAKWFEILVALDRAIGPGVKPEDGKLRDLTGRAEEVVAHASEEAARFKSELIMPEHLLLSAMRRNGTTSKLLSAMGITFDALFAAVAQTSHSPACG